MKNIPVINKMRGVVVTRAHMHTHMFLQRYVTEQDAQQITVFCFSKCVDLSSVHRAVRNFPHNTVITVRDAYLSSHCLRFRDLRSGERRLFRGEIIVTYGS